MKTKNSSIILITILFFTFSCKQVQNTENSSSNHSALNNSVKDTYLLLNENDEGYFYADKSGKTIIAEGKYQMCFTDTFRNYAIVITKENRFIAIDRNEKELYEVFVYDNGPDYAVEGMFRIKNGDKIGYANAKSGKIVIEAKYSAAYPFENGKAKVSLESKTVNDGEHSNWKSENWIFINKKGEVVE